MAVWHERMQAAKAVDMMDNADVDRMPTATAAADSVSGSVIERDQERSVFQAVPLRGSISLDQSDDQRHRTKTVVLRGRVFIV
jgi:hypothetical protein